MAVDLTGYHLTFDDEFNTLSASPNGSGTTWETKYFWGGRQLSGASDYYLDSSVGGLGQTPYSISNGALDIHAQSTSPELKAAGVTASFTTGQLDTHNSFSQEYGYFEMRAQVSGTYGTNSAFWLLPESGAWPPEIDVTETLGRDPKTSVMSNHYGSNNTTASSTANIGVDLSQGYHTYGLLWTPTTLTWYLDGVAKYTTATQADEHQAMYLLATLGVGGSWPGNPSTTNFSADMKIDYIRAYSNDSTVAAVSLDHVSSPDGVDTTPYGVTTKDGVLTQSPTPPPPPTGSGNLSVRVSEDAYNGNAQFIVKVDGQQVGGTYTATASHAAGQWQDIALGGTYSTGPHTIDVQFINDAWGGTATTDRNLYIQSVTINGETISKGTAPTSISSHPSDGSLELAGNGTATYSATGTVTPPPPANPPPTGSGLSVRVSEDAYQGDAQFIVKVDGQQVGGTYTTTASHAAGQWQDIAIGGTYATGPHTIAVQFTNDAWGGTATTDRNLYVQSVTLNGETVSNGTAPTSISSHLSDGSVELAGNGAVTYSTTGSGTTPPTTSSGLHVFVAEDAYNGNAQFIVKVDGQQVGGTYTATTLHSSGQWQDVNIGGTYSTGPHTIDVQFINDAWGGTNTTDRNLYVHAVTINGETVSNGTAPSSISSHLSDGSIELAGNGTVTYSSTGTGTTAPTGPTTPAVPMSTIILHVSEDAWNGNAQFNVLVDGTKVGSYTATASHAAGQVQDITITGDYGTTGPGHVAVQFTNDAWGGTLSTDRNLYVQSIDVNGQHFAASTATNNALNGMTPPADGSALLAINGTVDFNVNHTAAPTDYHLV